MRFNLQNQNAHSTTYKDLIRGEEPHKPKPSSPGQTTIIESFESHQPMPSSSPKWIKITESLVYFKTKDMQPLDTVEDKGFLHLLHTLEPRYQPPSRKTLSVNYLPSIYEREKQKISAKVSAADYFALTTDMWTSRANQSYTGVTVHFITTEFKIESCLLETREFVESHSAENIMLELEESVDQWGLLRSKLAAVVTDNGKNIVRAINDLEWPHVNCFSHTLQLAVLEAVKIPEISRAIGRCKRLVTHFNHSSKSTYLLNQKQINLNLPQHSLIQDVSTRWNSTYYMVEQVVEQQQALCAALLELNNNETFSRNNGGFGRRKVDNNFKSLATFIQVKEYLPCSHFF